MHISKYILFGDVICCALEQSSTFRWYWLFRGHIAKFIWFVFILFSFSPKRNSLAWPNAQLKKKKYKSRVVKLSSCVCMVSLVSISTDLMRCPYPFFPIQPDRRRVTRDQRAFTCVNISPLIELFMNVFWCRCQHFFQNFPYTVVFVLISFPRSRN